MRRKALPFHRQTFLHMKKEKKHSIIKTAFSWFDPLINIFDPEAPLSPHPSSRQILSTAQPVADRHRTDADIFGHFFNIDPTLFLIIHKPLAIYGRQKKSDPGPTALHGSSLWKRWIPYDAYHFPILNLSAICFLNDDFYLSLNDSYVNYII